MSPLLPVAVYGLEIPTGDVLVPAEIEFPATIRITMAAIDPTAAPETDGQGNVPSVPRSTLKIYKANVDGDDTEDEDYLESLLGGGDDEDSDEEDEEEPNGGPSDPSKSKKARREAAIKKLLAATQEDSDDEMEDAGAKANGAKSKGKAKASDEDEEESDEDDEDAPDFDMEEYVVCTLDTERLYQQPIDITVGEGEKIFFSVKGTHTVYLTGNYVVPQDEEEDSDEEYSDDEYDLPPGLEDEDEDEMSDELDGIDDTPRIKEIDTDEEEAPKLVATKKGKNKRVAEEAVEGLDEMMAKDEKKLSKKQQKKLKNNQGEPVAAEAEAKAKESPAAKGDKKVQFAKNLEQGPTGPAKDKAEAKGDKKGALGVKVVQGVTIDDRKAGSGRTVKSGDKVGMRYIGKLQNGKIFDSNKKGAPFSFKIGKGEVIKGWDIGILGMSVGGERRLTIPAHLAYGSRSMPSIPGNSTLIFDVKLIEIKICSAACVWPSRETLAKAISHSALSAKLRRHGVKVVTAFKSLTGSSSEQAIGGEQLGAVSGGHGTKSALALGIHKMSNAIFRPPLEPTVVRRTSPKSRPLLKETFQGVGVGTPPVPASASNPVHITASSNTTSSSKTSTSNSNSTKATQNSADSMFKNKDPNTVGRERNRFPIPNPSSQRTTRRSPITPPKADDPNNNNNRNLGTIQEILPLPLNHHHYSSPGIATVERAAAAKMYLETHFNELLGGAGPSPRQMRQQMLETDLFNRGRQGGGGSSSPLSSAENRAARARFCRRETEYLREMRVMKAGVLGMTRTTTATATATATAAGMVVEERCRAGDYETVKVLGKGSFGVVRLVREYRRGRVYAMKVIKKSKMLKSSQEGHLRAERDLLVASEGSRWIVPLVASFQDLASLYLVMEYMPGGDFLSLLIREHILPEPAARFYTAEIILCVEAAHSLKCIHRDIKPDNFLVSASGHLKISDFGLAFDGHWSHDTTYYTSHR
ncbi:hypothetical protein C8A00DRAFT_43676 [Chaetomidium leptoderma]|uniref:peptidylprolyl isomerase n=1 Tax=Chaetomidium leptoderma TaxID=669021 RepID=A0AAN6VLB6_9PEZI|nr:hypothetical protein C8A00DRAFT_43676 [Chaetomidium leptoderma]